MNHYVDILCGISFICPISINGFHGIARGALERLIDRGAIVYEIKNSNFILVAYSTEFGSSKNMIRWYDTSNNCSNKICSVQLIPSDVVFESLSEIEMEEAIFNMDLFSDCVPLWILDIEANSVQTLSHVFTQEKIYKIIGLKDPKKFYLSRISSNIERIWDEHNENKRGITDDSFSRAIKEGLTRQTGKSTYAFTLCLADSLNDKFSKLIELQYMLPNIALAYYSELTRKYLYKIFKNSDFPIKVYGHNSGRGSTICYDIEGIGRERSFIIDVRGRTTFTTAHIFDTAYNAACFDMAGTKEISEVFGDLSERAKEIVLMNISLFD